MEAAFFALDKTVIDRASMVAFGPALYRDGLLSRRLLLRAVWGNLVFLHLRFGEDRMARTRDAVLRVTRGWDHRRVERVVQEALEQVVEPIVYDEALELMNRHRWAGRRVVIVSASPEEVVAPLARHLGADGAIASRARLDAAGRYTGAVERYAYGPAKAEAMAAMAERDGIDLAASYAYSDSETDVPMLEAVGHPVAVNPDRNLARVARERDWEVLHFQRTVRMRERVSMPTARSTVAVGGGLVAVLAGSIAYLVLRRDPGPPSVRARLARRAGVTAWWVSRSLAASWLRARRGRRR